ncbi:hypothetical protein CTI14_47460, partial [Methylobacterium radiotolerans]
PADSKTLAPQFDPQAVEPQWANRWRTEPFRADACRIPGSMPPTVACSVSAGSRCRPRASTGTWTCSCPPPALTDPGLTPPPIPGVPHDKETRA